MNHSTWGYYVLSNFKFAGWNCKFEEIISFLANKIQNEVEVEVLIVGFPCGVHLCRGQYTTRRAQNQALKFRFLGWKNLEIDSKIRFILFERKNILGKRSYLRITMNAKFEKSRRNLKQNEK